MRTGGRESAWLPSSRRLEPVNRSAPRQRADAGAGPERVRHRSGRCRPSPGRRTPGARRSGQGAGGDEGGGVPMSEGAAPGRRSPLDAQPPQRCHVCLPPCFINEDQPRRIGAFALAGDQCLLLKLNPQPRRNRQRVSWPTAFPKVVRMQPRHRCGPPSTLCIPTHIKPDVEIPFRCSERLSRSSAACEAREGPRLTSGERFAWFALPCWMAAKHLQRSGVSNRRKRALPGVRPGATRVAHPGHALWQAPGLTSARRSR